jgi:redox-sensitive bicupin YhaK (pirin superfamily)
MSMSNQRKLRRVINAQDSADGDGVKIRRIAGRDVNAQLDPFLLLDEIRSDDSADYMGGFPAHPHRGFETITYMLEGAFRHKDHLGNEGVISSGDVQWMTAGRGVIHSEMPEPSDGRMHGFQLWLNLPAAEKMKPAAWQEIGSWQIPAIDLPAGGRVKVIAGSVEHEGTTVQGPVAQGSTRPTYLDVELAPDASWELAVDPEHSLLVLVFQGASTELVDGQMGIYHDGERLKLQASGEGMRALMLGGQPLREPIAQYGPFVMNTIDEVETAIRDYHEGRLVA